MSPSPKLPDPTLVEAEGPFEELMEVLDGESVISVDTEADSFFHYREKVCLIQVTAANRDFLVDPLADFDLSDFGRILADPAKTKVFHDGEYDVLILKRDFGFEFAGLFDTRIAAAALGDPNPGLASVLSNHFGVELDKSMQRSDWSRRPLSARQIDYARLDTHYLIALMEAQRTELAKLGRGRIVEGECRRVEALEPPPVGFDPDEFVRLKGATKLDPDGRQALRELFAMRDALAAERDVSPFRVLNNATLFELARVRPRGLAELDAVLSKKQSQRLGAEILDAIEDAADKGPLKKLPTPPRKASEVYLSEDEQEIHDRLKLWRKARAQREGYDSSLVLNRRVMPRLAQERPKSLEALREIEGLLTWQVESFGAEILEALAQAERLLTDGGGKRRRRSPRSPRSR